MVEEFLEKANQNSLKDLTRHQILENLKFFSPIPYQGKSVLHKSAVLCFAHQPEMFYEQAKSLFLIGNPRDKRFHRQEVIGPLSYQVTKLIDLVKSNLEIISYIADDGLRKEKLEIDLDVIRELISNAITHRDYAANAVVTVVITDNSLDIKSPGGFPPDASWLQLLSSSSSVSCPKNIAISHYLSRLLVFEGIGRGFDILREYIKENGEDSIVHKQLPNNITLIRVRRRRSNFISIQEDKHLLEEFNQPTKTKHIPLPPNPNFTGREDILQQIYQTLNADQTTVVTQAIAGLGGVGKTQLALAYCYAHLDDYDLIQWLNADSELGLGESVMELVRRLKLIAPNVTDQQVAIQAMQQFLSQTDQRWLLVYDNVDQITPKQLMPYLPHAGNGHVLITSRNPNYGGVGKVLEMDLFTQAEAVEFLLQRQGLKAERKSKEWDEAAALAEELGRFPLALEHAAGYVVSTGSSYAAYQRLFTSRQAELWNRTEAPDSYHATITTTWELAFAEVKKTPGALDLLNLCCFLDPESIPLALIKQIELETSDFLQNPDVLLAQVVADELALNDAIGALRRYSLIQHASGELSMHRLVQTVVHSRMGVEILQEWMDTTINLLYDVYHFEQYNMVTWTNAGDLLPHLISATTLASDYGFHSINTALLNDAVGFYLQFFGHYSMAREFYERAIVILEKTLGSHHPYTAVSLNNLGLLLQDMGDLVAARPYFERTLDIYEKSLGSDHPLTGTGLNNLGFLMQSIGDLATAQSYYERALAIREKALGPDHPNTAQSLNNLGRLLASLGDLTIARPYLERSLAIYEKALGPDHPDTATSLNNLGYLLQSIGDLVAAQPYYERALAIREKNLGPNHPDTATSLNNLGALLRAEGEFSVAQPYYESALAIREKVLGLNHPDTASSLNNLGALLQAMGDLAAARPYYERALTIFEKVLGPNHPDTARSLNNLGHLLQAMGDLAAARPYYERALAIRGKALGPDHPDTATSLNNLGALLNSMGDLTAAQSYFEGALAIFEKALGPDHPNTKIIRGNLSNLSEEMKK